MTRLALALLFSLIASAAVAQPATVIGPITPGNFAQFNSTTVIKDAGTSPSSFPASGVIYTPPGTGGTATTQQAYNQRVLWAADYGAKCDSTTDDSTAFQNLINEATALAVPARFIGQCKAAFTISTGAVDFSGVSPAQSVLFPPTSSGNTITITTLSSVYLHDFEISYGPLGGSSGSAIGINMGPGSGENKTSIFSNLVVDQAVNGIVMARSSGWVIQNSLISNFSSVGAIVNNVNNVDSGDSTIVGNTFIGGAAATQAIVWQSSGGLRIINNKINGSTLLYGIAVALASGATAGDIMITGNSIEGLSTAGSAILYQRVGTTGAMGANTVTGNEFNGGANCVAIPTDATGAWIQNIAITGNVCVLANSASAVGYAIDSTTTILISGNSTQSQNASTKEFVIGSAVTHCAIGTSARQGTFAASTFASGACDAIASVTLGTPTTVLHGNPTGPPTFGAVAISTDVGGLGTGIAAALGTNVGTAGAPVINGGALGSPSSAGTIPAFTLGGTIAGGGNNLNNIIIGATTPLAGTFTTIGATTINLGSGGINGPAGNLILNAGSGQQVLFQAAGSSNFSVFLPSAALWYPIPDNTISFGNATQRWSAGYFVSTFSSVHVSNGSVPVGTAGSCVASSFTGGSTAGKFSAAVCAAGTIILSALPTAPNGYTCNAQDQTTPADTLKQTANTTTSVTFTATTVASDVVAFSCIAW